MNETEMNINLKAIKNAWFYTVMFLFIWSMYELTKNGDMGLPFFLLTTQNLVWIGTELFLKRKMHKDKK